ncbi:Vitamin K-dependent protein S [Merluccius polli]|uniref:Vitamin K-dependent protein S n=1 Tax=Merluccius polli TaxID=89951 RepID=A0AA47MY60_MERPO|nr:Vitamin K-dependent protein S [Merluccius polli]
MWRTSLTCCCLALLLALGDAHRFISRRSASVFLERRRRANSLFEERMKGNLERECVEELCNKEEAREVFENQPETEYFYPKYIVCLGSHRVGINHNTGTVSSDLRTCVTEISNQCLPFPCYKEGTERCLDGHASFTCVCQVGWRGMRCEDDIDECSDPEFPAGCNQICLNIPGGFQCACEKGYYSGHGIKCIDIDECRQYPSICAEPARCVNMPGTHECQCPPGFKYDYSSKTCYDVDECERHMCDGECVNTLGSFVCHCEGREGLQLGGDGRSCEHIPVCLPLHDHTHPEMLYLGEQFTGLPLIYLHYRLPEHTKFSAEFDLRTFDPEGVVLYAEAQQGSWFLLGLRDGHIEVQFRTQHISKVTSGGRAINTGEWNVISVDELDNSISVKLGREALMSINSPESLFTSTNGKLETKIYIAGLPNRTNIIKPMNPRLDGCLRGWNLMEQGSSGVKEIIQRKKSKHCLVSVETGSYFTGDGLARFSIPYSGQVEVRLNIRPSSSTGVLFALVSNHSIPLSIAVVTQGKNEANLQVFLEGVSIATLDSLMLCYPEWLAVVLSFNATHLQVSSDSASSTSYATPTKLGPALQRLAVAMETPLETYVGGLPDTLPLWTSPVSAYYHGCMKLQLNGVLLDFDEAEVKHKSIKSHSCPPFSPPEIQPHRK